MTEKELVEKGIPYVVLHNSDGKRTVYELAPFGQLVVEMKDGKAVKVLNTDSIKL